MSRRLNSILLFIVFIICLLSGVYLYFYNYSYTISAIHTSFSFLLALSIFHHITRNFVALKSYFLKPRKNKKKRIPASFVVAIVLGILIGQLIDLPYFNTIYKGGANYRKYYGSTKLYEKRSVTAALNGFPLYIELLKQEDSLAQYHLSIWAEDAMGNYLTTFFSSDGSGFDKVLPVWTQRKAIAEGTLGIQIPTSKKQVVDGMSGATTLDNYIIETSIDPSLADKIMLYAELNLIGDTTSGFQDNEQPSIILATNIIDLQVENGKYFFNVIGHGHPSGATGRLFTELQKLELGDEHITRIIALVGKKI